MILAVKLKEYSCGHNTPGGCVYVPAGTKGVVGAVRVPSTCREGVVFCCVDFKQRIKFVNCYGKPCKSKHRKDLSLNFRVGALASQLV